MQMCWLMNKLSKQITNGKTDYNLYSVTSNNRERMMDILHK